MREREELNWKISFEEEFIELYSDKNSSYYLNEEAHINSRKRLEELKEELTYINNKENE